MEALEWVPLKPSAAPETGGSATARTGVPLKKAASFSPDKQRMPLLVQISLSC
jgi:hypothetical protein